MSMERKGGEKKMFHRELKPGPFAWYVKALLLLQACVARTIIIPAYITNLNCHELRVALLAQPRWLA